MIFHLTVYEQRPPIGVEMFILNIYKLGFCSYFPFANAKVNSLNFLFRSALLFN